MLSNKLLITQISMAFENPNSQENPYVDDIKREIDSFNYGEIDPKTYQAQFIAAYYLKNVGDIDEKGNIIPDFDKGNDTEA